MFTPWVRMCEGYLSNHCIRDTRKSWLWCQKEGWKGFDWTKLDQIGLGWAGMDWDIPG